MSFINDILTGVEKAILGGINDALGNIQPKGPTSGILPGDVVLENVTLMSEDEQRKYNLTAQVKGIEIYESIISPVIFCELTVQDSMGLHQSFPINGEEFVSVMFKTPKTPRSAQYLFRVNQVKNKVIKENNKMATYTLQCVSAELMRNSNRIITKKYEDNIGNLVKDIVTNDLQTSKPVNVDNTSGIEKGIMTRLRPFRAIDFLRRRAVSTEYVSSSFVFFENRNGYHFTTIEKLMDWGGRKVELGTDKEFFFDTSRKESINDVTLRNILAYNQLTFTDTISKVASGGVTNKVQSVNLLTKNVKKVTYTDNIGADKFKTASKDAAGLNSTSFTINHGKNTAITKIIPVSADKPVTQLAEKMSILQAYAQKISQNIVQIHIYGDSEITVGDVIKCSFPSSTSNSEDKPNARLDSGNYLVAKVKHMIINSDRPQHTMSLELIKGSLEGNV